MSGRGGYHPLVHRLLDGEIGLADLPSDLRQEGETALRLLAPGPEVPPGFSPWFDQRVMGAVRRRPHLGAPGVWGWLARPVELRLRLRIWTLGGALALLVVLAALWRTRPSHPADLAASDSVYVRFVLYAPDVQRVAIAGSFNEWNPERAPLAPTGMPGLWSTTIALPLGQHLYAFVIDGTQWLADPAAPAVDDGFGRRNSVMTVSATRGEVL